MHVGTARTALFNWLFAHQQRRRVHLAHRGHRRRAQPRRVASRGSCSAGLARARLRRGPVPPERQLRSPPRRCRRCSTQRLPLLLRLHARGDRRAQGARRPPGYDGFCRDRGLARSETTALRFRTPREGVTVVHDVIRGDVEFANSLIEDFVVVRSSGVRALRARQRRPTTAMTGSPTSSAARSISPTRPSR